MNKAKPLPPEVEARKQQLLALTDAFCEARLDRDYLRLCRKLVNRMSKRKPPTFMSGKIESWAAGAVHAIGAFNFLFDKSRQPHVSAPEIAAHFGVSPATASQKAALLREEFEIDMPYLEWATKSTQEVLMPALEMMLETGALAEMLGPPPRKASRAGGEFIDGDHEVMTVFYEVGEAYQSGQLPAKQARGFLEELIAEDPDYYDPYLMLAGLLPKKEAARARELMETAYQRAVARIVTPKRGNWPKRLQWGWLENRHILRTLQRRAIQFWEEGDITAALDLYRRLFQMDPEDGIGARYHILAMRMGLTLDQLEKAVAAKERGFLDAGKMLDWFDRHSAEFPDEFDAWKREVGYGKNDPDGDEGDE